MNLRDLKYFVALADIRHFGKAAKACFVSQPSLSIQIKKLETFLGVALLERTNRSVLLTDIGKIIAEQARELLQRAESIQEAAKQAQDPFSGELKLGVIPTLTTYLLPYLLPELTKTESFPKLSIYLTEQQNAELLLQLKQGKLDAALISLPVEKEDFVVHPLFEEALLLAVPEQHALAKKKQIKLADLKGKELLLLEEGHCLREQALDLCEKVSAIEAKKCSAASLEILRYMVASKVGITLMPRLAVKKEDKVTYLGFSEAQPKRRIAIVWRTSSAKRLLLESMVGHIQRLLLKEGVVKVIQRG